MATLSSVKVLIRQFKGVSRWSTIQLMQWLEQRHPQIGSKALSYASILGDPQLAVRGLIALRKDEFECRLKLPNLWQNRGADQRVSRGVLLTVSEGTLQLYLNHVFAGLLRDLHIDSSIFRSEEPLSGPIEVSCHLPAVRQTQMQMEMMQNGKLTCDIEVLLFNPQGRRLASVDFTTTLIGHKAILSHS